MSKIGLVEYYQTPWGKMETDLLYGFREPSLLLRLWWHVSDVVRTIRARVDHWFDRWEMNRADGLYYKRSIGWRGRRIWWWSEPDAPNMWADGDWVEISEPIKRLAVYPCEVRIETAEMKYRLTGNPDDPFSMRIEQTTL